MFLSEESPPQFPDTPTAREIGVDLVVSDSRVWLAPKGTPSDRIEYITNALREVMAPGNREGIRVTGNTQRVWRT